MRNCLSAQTGRGDSTWLPCRGSLRPQSVGCALHGSSHLCRGTTLVCRAGLWDRLQGKGGDSDAGWRPWRIEKPSLNLRISRQNAQAAKSKVKPAPTYTWVGDSILVLFDPKRKRLIYVAGVEGSAHAKMRKLLQASKPQAAYFLEEVEGQFEGLRRLTVEEYGLWTYSVHQGPDSQAQPESKDEKVASSAMQPDWMASRMTNTELSLMQVYRQRMMGISDRYTSLRSSRWSGFAYAYRNARREFHIGDSIAIVQNKDIPSEDSPSDNSSEGPAQFNCEIQLGPGPDDYTVRIRTGHNNNSAANYQHLERCFKEESEYLQQMIDLEEQWRKETGSAEGLDSDWGRLQSINTTTGMAKAASNRTSSSSSGSESDEEGEVSTSAEATQSELFLMRPVRRPQVDEGEEDEAAAADPGASASAATSSASASQRSSSSSSASSSTSSSSNLSHNDLSDLELTEALLGRKASMLEVAQLRAAIAQASDVENRLSSPGSIRNSPSRLRSALEPFLKAVGADFTVIGDRVKRSNKRRLIVPPDVVALAEGMSDDASDEEGNAPLGQSSTAAMVSMEGAQGAQGQQQALAELCMKNLRVPSSHRYAKGKDVLVVASKEVLPVVAGMWETLERRVMVQRG